MKEKKKREPFAVRKKRFLEEPKAEIKRSKPSFIVYVVLSAAVVAILVRSLITRNYENSASCVLVLLLFLLPNFVERKLKIEFPMVFEIIIFLFIFAAQILGEMNSFYIRFPWWDTMLHTLNGFLFAAVGFGLCDIMNQNAEIKFKLSPFFLSLVAFCFSMTIGVLWEFFEFSMDKFFLFDMQKDTLVTQFASVNFDTTNTNIMVKVIGIGKTVLYDKDGNVLKVINGGYLDIGISDTMKDLFVNLIGALVFSVFGYLYVKTRGMNKLAKNFIPVLRTDSSKPEAVETEKDGSSLPEKTAKETKEETGREEKKE